PPPVFSLLFSYPGLPLFSVSLLALRSPSFLSGPSPLSGPVFCACCSRSQQFATVRKPLVVSFCPQNIFPPPYSPCFLNRSSVDCDRTVPGSFPIWILSWS